MIKLKIIEDLLKIVFAQVCFGQKNAHKDLTHALVTLEFSTFSITSILFPFNSILQPTSRCILIKHQFITTLSCSGNCWLPITHHVKLKLFSRHSWHFTIRSTLFTQPHLRFCPTMKPYTSVGFLSLSLIIRWFLFPSFYLVIPFFLTQ